MSLSRTWYTDANLAVSDFSTAALLAKSILWGFKALLKGEAAGTNGGSGARPGGSLWTCESSSDGAGNFNMAGTDLWTAAFDATKLNRASGAANHSWIVLKSPAALGPLYMLLDWNTATDVTVIVRFSYNAFGTGGSATAAPTSTGSWVHSTDGGATTSMPFNDGTATAHKLHMVRDASGNFWFTTSKNTTGRFWWMVGVQTLSELRTGDTKNVFSFLHYNATAPGAGSLFTAGTAQAHFNNLNGLSAANTNPIVCGGRTFDNLAVALGGPFSVAFADHGNAATGSPGTSTNGQRNELNAADGKWDTYPVWVHTNNTTKAGYRGRIPDISACPPGAAVGSANPTAAAMERTVIGGLLIPFEVVPSL